MTKDSVVRRPLRTLLACALIAAAGCESVLAPADVAGTYALVSVGGMSLPYTLPDGTPEHTIITDTLILGADGRGTWITVRDVAYPSPTTPTRIRETMPVVLERRRDALVLVEGFACQYRTDCRPPESFTLRHTGEGLEVGAANNARSFRRVAH